ncbi:hypothetical protein RB195_011217 [Necator americanus]
MLTLMLCPTFLAQREIFALVGTEVNMHCNQSQGHERWIHKKDASSPENVIVPSESIQILSKMLKIKNVQREHAGIYLCDASSRPAAFLYVGVAPPAPANLHVRPKRKNDYTILTIHWENNTGTIQDVDEHSRAEYVLEIVELRDPKNWIRIFRVRNCCNIEYEYRGPPGHARLRIYATNKYGKNKSYSISGSAFLFLVFHLVLSIASAVHKRASIISSFTRSNQRIFDLPRSLTPETSSFSAVWATESSSLRKT